MGRFGIAYGNGVFVAVLGNSQILTSTDGAVWTTREPLTNSLLNAVAFGAGQFVVVGQAGVILSSGNATDWTVRNSGTSTNLYDVQFADHTFLVWGSGGTVLQSDPVIQLNVTFNPTAQLTISGPTGAVYRVEAFADLNPTNSWQVLTNLVIPFTPYTWSSAEAPTDAMRFYRAVMLAP